jgi:hypothetical protein
MYFVVQLVLKKYKPVQFGQKLSNGTLFFSFIKHATKPLEESQRA